MPGEENVLFGDVSPDSDTDHDLARDNLLALLQSGSKSYQTLTELAEKSQNARVYEVLSTLLKTLVESNEALIRLKEKRIQMRAPAQRAGTEVKNQQNIFMGVGTTADLQELFKQAIKKEK